MKSIFPQFLWREFILPELSGRELSVMTLVHPWFQEEIIHSDLIRLSYIYDIKDSDPTLWDYLLQMSQKSRDHPFFLNDLRHRWADDPHDLPQHFVITRRKYADIDGNVWILGTRYDRWLNPEAWITPLYPEDGRQSKNPLYLGSVLVDDVPDKVLKLSAYSTGLMLDVSGIEELMSKGYLDQGSEFSVRLSLLEFQGLC